MKKYIEIIMFSLCWVVVVIIAVGGIITMTASASTPVKDTNINSDVQRLYSATDAVLNVIYEHNTDYFLDVLMETDEWQEYCNIANELIADKYYEK